MKKIWKGWAAIDLTGNYPPVLCDRRAFAREEAKDWTRMRIEWEGGIRDAEFVVRKVRLVIEGGKK